MSDLGPLVPGGLAMDTYDGTAYVGLVLFAVEAARAPGVPPALGLRFQETNVRTYVRLDDGEPGLLFVFARSRLGSRSSAPGSPYFWAAGREYVSERTVVYMLCRCTGARPVTRGRSRSPTARTHCIVARGGSRGRRCTRKSTERVGCGPQLLEPRRRLPAGELVRGYGYIPGSAAPMREMSLVPQPSQPPLCRVLGAEMSTCWDGSVSAGGLSRRLPV